VLAVAGGFEPLWDRFHEVVFTNDLWRLNPATDRLIQMFPEAFWAEATFIVGALTVAEALAIVIAAVACLLFSRDRSGEEGPPAARPARAIRIRARRVRTSG
jgi:integral membrane protein (TIGR01906 family)